MQQGGLARAGGPGHVDQPVRLAEQLLQVAAVGRKEPELRERPHARGLVDDADDDRFAMDGRNAGEAQVVGARADQQRRSSVLRAAALGDVHPPGDLGGLQEGLALRLLDEAGVDQPAVDPLADVQAVFPRLEMKIRRPLGHRLAQELLEDAPGRRRRRPGCARSPRSIRGSPPAAPPGARRRGRGNPGAPRARRRRPDRPRRPRAGPGPAGGEPGICAGPGPARSAAPPPGRDCDRRRRRPAGRGGGARAAASCAGEASPRLSRSGGEIRLRLPPPAGPGRWRTARP